MHRLELRGVSFVWPLGASALLLGLLFFLPGCATDQNTHAGERFMVNAQRTLFYKFGPVQPTGPDLALYQGQRVTMLRRQFGYSHVALETGQTGYVATEDMAPAPPDPAPAPTPTLATAVAPAAGRGSGPQPRRSEPRGRRPTAAEEAAVPPPDLPIQ